ncbi:carbon storage regulator [Acidaminobacterium chupaoyuni]
MLVVTRKAGSSVIIELGDGQEPIEISVLENGSQVKLGIVAPQQCKVWRDEIYQTVIENRQAATSGAIDIKSMLASLPKEGETR